MFRPDMFTAGHLCAFPEQLPKVERHDHPDARCQLHHHRLLPDGLQQPVVGVVRVLLPVHVVEHCHHHMQGGPDIHRNIFIHLSRVEGYRDISTQGSRPPPEQPNFYWHDSEKLFP